MTVRQEPRFRGGEGIIRMMTTRRILPLMAASLFAAVSAQATTINWASSLSRTNLTSAGAVMDAGFRFELGVFKSGFVPTATNTDQWAANWVPAQRTPYNAVNRWFTTNHVVTNNTSPFTVGARGYVWGFGEGATGGEWILFRGTNWTWPAPNPDSPIILSWVARNATSVVLGDVQNSGAYHMKTAAVANAAGPVVTWDEWRAGELARSAKPNGTPGDLDANGVPDVFDYSLQRGANPNPGAWMSWHEADGKRYLEVRIPRRADRQAAFIVEVSSDLREWRTGAAVTEVVADTAAALVVRDKTPVGEGGDRRFLRVRAVAGS